MRWWSGRSREIEFRVSSLFVRVVAVISNDFGFLIGPERRAPIGLVAELAVLLGAVLGVVIGGEGEGFQGDLAANLFGDDVDSGNDVVPSAEGAVEGGLGLGEKIVEPD